MQQHNERLPGGTITVIIRDNSPFVDLQEPPTNRSVQISLTDEQRELLALRCTGMSGGRPLYEEISQCFLEPNSE